MENINDVIEGFEGNIGGLVSEPLWNRLELFLFDWQGHSNYIGVEISVTCIKYFKLYHENYGEIQLVVVWLTTDGERSDLNGNKF